MKSEFNKNWNRSVQPRKQRKFRANAPNHIKRKFMGCNLDKELRAKYGMRSIEVRKGDSVKIMRGKFSGKQGKVGMVDVKGTRVQVEGVQRVKKMGGEKLVTWFHPSNVKIIILNVDDSKRIKNIKKVETEKADTDDVQKNVTEKKEKKRVKKIKTEGKK